MAGINKVDGFRLSAPAPLQYNRYFDNATARLATGQLRHVDWGATQGDGTQWQLQPLALCLNSDGTPATQAGTWGSLPVHWRQTATVDMLPIDYFAVSDAIRTAVVKGNYNANNELADANPAGTLPGQAFVYGGYYYTAMPSSNDGALHWQRINKLVNPPGNTTGGGTVVYYSAPGQNTDGAMTQKAVTDYVTTGLAPKTDAVTLLSLTGAATPYNTINAAVGAAGDGQTLVVRGPYAPGATLGKSLIYDLTGAVFNSSSPIIGPFTGSALAGPNVNITTHGGYSRLRVPVTTGGGSNDSTIYINNLTIDGPGWLELFALNSTGAGKLIVTLRRCYINRTAITATASQNGAICYQARDGQIVMLYLEDCVVYSAGVLFDGYLVNGSKIYLRGNTRLIYTTLSTLHYFDGNPTGAAADPATFLVDERNINPAGIRVLDDTNGNYYRIGTSSGNLAVTQVI